MMKSIYFAAVALLLTACASAPPRQSVNLDVAMPATWSARIESAADSNQIKIDWWTSFHDSSLNLVISQSLQRNLNLDKAASALAAAAAQARIAGASVYPTIGGSLTGSRRKQNFIGFPIPGAEGGILSTTTTTFGVSMNLSWELDLWGRLRAQHSSATAQFQAAQADFYGAQLSLAGQTSKAFFAVVTAKKQLELSRATFESWKQSSDQVQRRYTSGLTTALEYRLTLSNLALAEANLATQQRQYEASQRQLELLLKRYPAAEISFVSDLPSITEEIPAGLPADIISRRPDVLAAERRLAAAYMGGKSARRALYPQISLTSSKGTSTKDLADLLNGDYGVWSLAGNLLQPIFQGGLLRANVDLSRAQAKQALADYQSAVLAALAEVESALSNEQLSSVRERALHDAAEQSKAALRLAEDQYSRGVISFLTKLESTRSAYDTESRYLDAKQQRLDARVDTYLALGGGFVFDNELALTNK